MGTVGSEYWLQYPLIASLVTLQMRQCPLHTLADDTKLEGVIDYTWV